MDEDQAPELAAQLMDHLNLSDSSDSESSPDDEVNHLELLRAKFPNAVSDAQQIRRRHLLRGSFVEVLFSTMLDESNLEFFLQSRITLNLPADLLDQVMVRDDMWRLRTPRYLPLVLTPWTRTVVICCGERRAMTTAWTLGDLDHLVHLIVSTCKDSLVNLTIHNAHDDEPGWPEVSAEQLHILLHGIKSLQQLHVDRIYPTNTVTPSHIVTDTTLQIIAERHKNIRAVPYPLSASLDGLQLVLDNCKKLEHLSMIGSEDSFRAAILQAPSLQSIRTVHPDILGECVQRISTERDPADPPFSLRGVVDVVGSVQQFEQIHKVFPHLSFTFYCYQSYSDFPASLLAHRSKFSVLTLDSCWTPRPPVMELVQHFSANVTYIHFLKTGFIDLVIDLAVIGYFCINLKVLEAGGLFEADPVYTNLLETRHFGALEILDLFETRYAPLPPALPDGVLVRVLGGERLKHALVTNVQVSDSVAVGLEQEAREEGKALGSLQVLYCGEGFEESAVVRIVINAPKLMLLHTNLTGVPPLLMDQFFTDFNHNLRVGSGVPSRNLSFL